MSTETITEAPKPVPPAKHPRSIIPFRALKIFGLAVVVVVIFMAMITNSLQRPMRDLTAPDTRADAPPPTTAEDVRQLEADLRQKQIEMAKARAAVAAATLVGGSGTGGVTPTTGAGRSQRLAPVQDGEMGDTAPGRRAVSSDRYADEMARREYESLFASSTIPATASSTTRGGVAPRAPATGLSARPVLASATEADDDEPPTQEPTLDEITQAVVKAMGPSVLAPPALQPVPAATPPAAQGVPGAQATPSRPAGSLVAYEGTILDGVTVNRLDGGGGPINARLVNPLYSHDRKLMIPAGATVLGKCQPAEGFSDERIGCGFHRLIMNDGTSVSLDNFTGLSRRGDQGIKARVDRHYLATFGAAAAVGVISGLGQWIGSGGGYGQGDGNNNTTVVMGSVGDSTTQAAMQTMSHFLNRAPTVTVDEGTAVKVYLTADLFLPPYKEKP